ncbi:flagellar radial spoke protein 3 [Selaginella moellendorffii]|uniref:Flagellar radial spoke protein 3 n=1 Tax=Selaginella moellendorffii TaxID=88036 RepID=D8RD15_SELML|nr:flagellar radial spoke protein 3 [Selaginella moellendorffii]EFJ29937.1 flagellar radial spoke protein 3 [Selaginella moellendorffii]|eukprot:XP_002968821.1 flagellar radial spoke protein 3 [Selaginella moellendorffii]
MGVDRNSSRSAVARGSPSPRAATAAAAAAAGGLAPPVAMSGGPPLNLMFDPRVVRGPTYSKMKTGFKAEPPPPERKAAKKKRKVPAYSTTPPTIDGRKNMDIQTDVYLEELVDRIPEYDIDTQTDPFLDRPATPLFIPQKPGPDIGTQIEEGDLFNFDEEVEPMLEVLVGRTVEQAWMEVTEERQLAELHKHQDHFEKIRAAELVATQRMEFSEWRKIEEKKRRVEQEKKRLEEERKLKELIETQNFAREYLKKMTDSVLSYLESEDYFYDPVEREVENYFMPMLAENMERELEKIVCARNTLHCVVEAATISQESRALNVVSAMVNTIIMSVESYMTEVATADSADYVRDVLDIVEQTTRELTASSTTFFCDFLRYFESVEMQVVYEVRTMLRRVITRHEEEEQVAVEVGAIFRRVVEQNTEPPPAPPPEPAAAPPPPPAEGEEAPAEGGGQTAAE